MWFRFQNDSIALSDGIGYTTYRINLPTGKEHLQTFQV